MSLLEVAAHNNARRVEVVFERLALAQELGRENNTLGFEFILHRARKVDRHG